MQAEEKKSLPTQAPPAAEDLSKDPQLDKLAEYAKEDEAENKELADFDPFELVNEAQTVKTITDKKLGTVRFTELTYADQVTIEKIKDPYRRESQRALSLL